MDSLNSLHKDSEDDIATSETDSRFNLKKLQAPAKPRVKILRLCDTYSSQDKEETPVPSMFERGYYRPEKRWII